MFIPFVRGLCVHSHSLRAFLTLPTFSIPFVFITYGPLCSFPTLVLADDIPNWPTLVVPSLACSVTSLFPSDTAFKILLAVATAFFVFDASGKNLLSYCARHPTREILCERHLLLLLCARHLPRPMPLTFHPS